MHAHIRTAQFSMPASPLPAGADWTTGLAFDLIVPPDCLCRKRYVMQWVSLIAGLDSPLEHGTGNYVGLDYVTGT